MTMTRGEMNEIRKQVYEKFPVSKAEKKCADEKRTMDDLRSNFRKKLIAESKEKREFK